MPKHYKRHHAHGRRYRRHRKHHIGRPLVSNKYYTKIVCRTIQSITSDIAVAGEWYNTSAISWQQPTGLIAQTEGFNFVGSEWFAHYKDYEQYAITGMSFKYEPV